MGIYIWISIYACPYFWMSIYESTYINIHIHMDIHIWISMASPHPVTRPRCWVLVFNQDVLGTVRIRYGTVWYDIRIRYEYDTVRIRYGTIYGYGPVRIRYGTVWYRYGYGYGYGTDTDMLWSSSSSSDHHPHHHHHIITFSHPSIPVSSLVSLCVLSVFEQILGPQYPGIILGPQYPGIKLGIFNCILFHF